MARTWVFPPAGLTPFVCEINPKFHECPVLIPGRCYWKAMGKDENKRNNPPSFEESLSQGRGPAQPKEPSEQFWKAHPPTEPSAPRRDPCHLLAHPRTTHARTHTELPAQNNEGAVSGLTCRKLFLPGDVMGGTGPEGNGLCVPTAELRTGTVDWGAVLSPLPQRQGTSSHFSALSTLCPAAPPGTCPERCAHVPHPSHNSCSYRKLPNFV